MPRAADGVCAGFHHRAGQHNVVAEAVGVSSPRRKPVACMQRVGHAPHIAEAAGSHQEHEPRCALRRLVSDYWPVIAAAAFGRANGPRTGEHAGHVRANANAHANGVEPASICCCCCCCWLAQRSSNSDLRVTGCCASAAREVICWASVSSQRERCQDTHQRQQVHGCIHSREKRRDRERFPCRHRRGCAPRWRW